MIADRGEDLSVRDRHPLRFFALPVLVQLDRGLNLLARLRWLSLTAEYRGQENK